MTLADGQPNGSPRSGHPYGRVSWDDIRQLVDEPAGRDKDRAHLVILSSYTECDGRTHAVQRERGLFHGLAVDIDAGNPSMAEVVQALWTAIGDVSAEVYSSSSASAEARKWRILIPLACPITGAEYADTQAALFGLLAACGLQCDATLTRAAQPIFLPNVPPKRRGPDGRPLFYQSCHVDGPTLDLVADHPVMVARAQLQAARSAEEAAAEQRAKDYQASRLAYTQATGDHFEPIAHFNEHHSVRDLMIRYGFTKDPKGKGSKWRSPLSTSGSYATEERGDYWVTASNWANAHNIGRTSRKGFRHGDAFDLYVYFEHAGDRSAAVREYARQVRPAACLERVRAPQGKAGESLSADACRAILSQSRLGDYHKHLAQLAGILGVSAEVLEQLGMGWRFGDVARGHDLHAGDWTIPMRDGLGQVVGVFRRLAVPFLKAGKPICELRVKASRMGLLYAPSHWQQGGGPILVPPTMADTAAAMTMQLSAVGLLAGRAGVGDLVQLLADADRPIIVIGAGAEHTAKALAKGIDRPVMWSMVPEPAQDAREWMASALASGTSPAEAGQQMVALLLATATSITPPAPDPVLDGRLTTVPEVALDDLRATMRARMMQLAEPPLLQRLRPTEEHPDGQSRLVPGVHLNRGGTGIGKSRSALELAIEIQQQGLRVAYLSQTHKLSAERRDEAKGLGLADCAADPEITAETCGMIGKAKQVRACGLSVQQVLCPSCPLAATCLYQARKKEAKEAAVRFACHAAGSQDLSQLAGGRDAIVFDEDALQALVRFVKVRPKHLLSVLRVLRTIGKARPKLMDDETQLLLDLFSQATERLLAAVRKSTTPGTLRIDLTGLQVPDDSQQVRWSCKLWRLLGHSGQKAPPKDALSLLLDVVTGRFTEAWVTHDRHADGHWDRQLVGIQRHRLPHKLNVMLDATADAATLERVIAASGTTWTRSLLHSVQVMDPEGRAPDKHEARRIVPVGGDVICTSRPARTTEVARGLLSRVPGKRLGLITHGAALAAMVGGPDAEGGGLLDDHEMARLAKVAGHHTAATRGSNSWMADDDQDGLDAVLVIGAPNLPWSEVRLRLLLTAEFEAAALPDGGWVRHEVLSTTPDGGTVKNHCMGHTDPAWQEARRQLVHAALLQAVGRARHTLKEGCKVYCVTEEPMPGMLTDPVPLEPIDEQTHYLMLEVAGLGKGAENTTLPASENDLERSTGADIKTLKYSSAFIGNDVCGTAVISTGDLHTRMASIGWSHSTTERALARAALLGMLSQPERGLWALPPPPQTAQEPPTGPQEPVQVVAAPVAPIPALEPHSESVEPHTRPAVVISASCAEQPDSSSHAVVIASAPDRQADPALGYFQQEVVQPHRPVEILPDAAASAQRVEPIPDPAALAWLAMSTPDEFALWQERAAIMQWDGGLTQRQAEVQALGYLFAASQRAEREDVLVI